MTNHANLTNLSDSELMQELAHLDARERETAQETAERHERLRQVINTLYGRGRTWQELGDLRGLSRQSVHEFARRTAQPAV